MKLLCTLLTLVLLSLPSGAQAVEYRFASVEEGQAILLSDIKWFEGLGSAEIAVRMEAAVPDQTADDLKAMYLDNVLAWSPEDIAAHKKVINSQAEALAPFVHLLPDTVWFVKMSNRIEGGMPHTRKNAIFLPGGGRHANQHLFLHELFHILSRAQSPHRETLYNTIGFQSCQLAQTPWIERRRLSNPDVPLDGFYLKVENRTFNGVIPWLHVAHDAYTPAVNGGFGGHFDFGLLSVTVSEGTCIPRNSGTGVPILLPPADVPEFYDAIGQNTGYIIHPEEVLADNFVYLVTAKKGLPNPEIVQNLKQWLVSVPNN